MARVLILHASVGAGHKRAAEALGRSFALRRVEKVKVADTLDYAAPLYRRVYRDGYLELSEKAPALWAYAYERSDHDPSRRARQLRLLVNRLGVTGLDRLIAEFVPDAIVCTHFLPLNLLARERVKGDLPIPLYGVVTDYTGHAFWVYPGVDGYFVATPETAAMLARRGALAATIAVTGIPIDPAIAASKDAAAIRAARGLDRAPVVTLMGGGVSVDSVRTIVSGLLERGLMGTLVVVAGRNTALQAALGDLRGTERLTLRVLGFIDYVDDLAAASDLVITKAGGLIVSELLARGTPMALVEPIPGQEEWNADYVVGVGAGIQLRLAEMAAPAVQHLLETPGWLPLLRDGAARAGRPRAALAVADAVLAATAASAASTGMRGA